MDSTYPLTPLVVLVSIAAAVGPTLAFVGIVYWVDRYEKEPAWLLAATFLWGAIPSIITAFILNTVLSSPSNYIFGPVIADVIGAAFFAPVIEESLKGLAILLILIGWRSEIDSLLDGIIYGAMIGLGFAMVENVLYYLFVYVEGGSDAWSANILYRGIVFGLNHALFTSLTGLGVAAARLSSNPAMRMLAPVGGWAMAILLHFIHNLLALIGGVALAFSILNAWGGLALMGTIIVWALLQERKWLRLYLAEEVINGTLTAGQYSLACSSTRRMGHRLRLLRSHGFSSYRLATKFYRQCSELAYKKHHFAILEEAEATAITSGLREDVAELGRQLLF